MKNYLDFFKMDIQTLKMTQKTIEKMLEDRHDSEILNIDENDTTENILVWYVSYYDTETIVIWYLVKGFGVNPLKECVKVMEQYDLKSGIIVKCGKLTPAANTSLIDLNNLYDLQIFDVEELVHNKTEHSLVPKHELLTIEEANNLLKQYKVKLTQLPHIKVNDPIIKYYGWKKGRIVRIIRKSGEITYRSII